MFTEGYCIFFLFLEDFLMHIIPHLKVKCNLCTTNNGIAKVMAFLSSFKIDFPNAGQKQ